VELRASACRFDLGDDLLATLPIAPMHKHGRTVPPELNGDVTADAICRTRHQHGLLSFRHAMHLVVSADEEKFARLKKAKQFQFYPSINPDMMSA
jgi:hypothetical protein